MDLIQLSCIIFLVISAFALTDSAVLLTENSQFKAPEENNHDRRQPSTTRKEPDNYITTKKLKVESDASWYITIHALYGWNKVIHLSRSEEVEIS